MAAGILVFPERSAIYHMVTYKGLPHTRGDAPGEYPDLTRSVALTPHAWGCTADQGRDGDRGGAYPTRVGMHRRAATRARRTGRLPHTRGDAPNTPIVSSLVSRLTPHAWGCTRAQPLLHPGGPAYPTRVGMHLRLRRGERRDDRLPHTRGDAPVVCHSREGTARLTPHAWGCTAHGRRYPPGSAAYPTRVGMHRSRA